LYDLQSMIERVKTLKKEKNLTNEQLAIKSGVPIGTLSKILSGNTKDPSISTIIKVAECLNTSADYLIFGEHIKNQVILSNDELQIVKDYSLLSNGWKDYIKKQIEIAKQMDKN